MLLEAKTGRCLLANVLRLDTPLRDIGIGAAAGVSFVLLEASDGIGGRVRTDVVDGFTLDRGFAIFLTSYPETQVLPSTAGLKWVRLKQTLSERLRGGGADVKWHCGLT